MRSKRKEVFRYKRVNLNYSDVVNRGETQKERRLVGKQELKENGHLTVKNVD